MKKSAYDRSLTEMSKDPETVRRLAATVVSAVVWNILYCDGRRVGVRPDGIDVDLRGDDETERKRRHDGAICTAFAGAVDAVRDLPISKAVEKADDLLDARGVAMEYPDNSLARVLVNEMPVPVEGIGRARFSQIRADLKVNAESVDEVESFLRTTPWEQWNLDRIEKPWDVIRKRHLVNFVNGDEDGIAWRVR